MKAIVYTEYGEPDVLHLAEVAKPVPKDNEILIRVIATPVSYGDVLARNFKAVTPRKFTMPGIFWLPARLTFGWNKPRKTILGSEFAGEVESVGKTVTRFKAGDQVFGYCGDQFGAYAEYLCIPENKCVAVKPTNMTYEEAAALSYGAIMALDFLNKVRIQRGQKILINGASGGIGAMAVQLGKYYGAEVTGVCSTQRMDYVKSLGADKVIDYTQTNFAQNSETYDLILDVLGKSSFAHCKPVLKPNGVYFAVSFKMKHLLQMAWTSLVGRQKVICTLASEKVEHLLHIKNLVESGDIKVIVDRCYPLEQATEAHCYVENGHKKGQVVITVGH